MEESLRSELDLLVEGRSVKIENILSARGVVVVVEIN